jgi:hypothetical protein
MRAARGGDMSFHVSFAIPLRPILWGEGGRGWERVGEGGRECVRWDDGEKVSEKGRENENDK